MELLKELIVVSEKAANVARLCRQEEHLFGLLVEKKCSDANPRFVEDFKTLADVLIQEVVKHDVVKKFPELEGSIFGEENNVFSNQLGETIAVEVKPSQRETAELLQVVLNQDKRAAELLAGEVHKEVTLESVRTAVTPSENFSLDLVDVGIWIDPIDSTAEYINGGEEADPSGISISGLKCVTVLIGAYDKKSGLPLIGIVNQPFTRFHESDWSGTCFWGSPVQNSILRATPRTDHRICVSSNEDQQIVAKLQQSGFHIVEASGAGYKILTVITGVADAYLLTKDTTFKWDTCGPQAVLRALGGDLVVYNTALAKDTKSVNYNDKDTCNHGGIIAFREGAVLKHIIDSLVY